MHASLIVMHDAAKSLSKQAQLTDPTLMRGTFASRISHHQTIQKQI
ncbi:hypothetical protein [Acidiphilium sp. JA12-A1]|nr:hypothetical protein [Acidiphilium sp. JA12-A1]